MIIWEHLGMMGQKDYRQKWVEKEEFYSRNGFVRGKNLFVTLEQGKSGIDSQAVSKLAKAIKSMLAD